MTSTATSRSSCWSGRTVHPDWPKLEEEEALREVEYDLAQDLEAHGEEMSSRPTSDEG